MVAYLKYAPSGFPGNISRPGAGNNTIEPVLLGSPAPQVFGAPVKISSNKAIPFAGGEVPSNFYGILVQSTPAEGGGLTNANFTDTIPNPNNVQQVLVSGYASVICTVGTPVRGGQVYARTVTNGSKAIGDLEATADITGAGTAGTNTGNGTISAITAAPPAQQGTYQVVFTAATKFGVFDPSGSEMLNGSTGVAYSDKGIGFTITAGGTAFVAGDTFNIAVSQNNIALPGVTWAAAGVDANNIAELRIK